MTTIRTEREPPRTKTTKSAPRIVVADFKHGRTSVQVYHSDADRSRIQVVLQAEDVYLHLSFEEGVGRALQEQLGQLLPRFRALRAGTP